jgi:hypothetical protein
MMNDYSWYSQGIKKFYFTERSKGASHHSIVLINSFRRHKDEMSDIQTSTE